MSFANSEILPALAGAVRPLLGRDPYNKRNVDEAIKLTDKTVGVLDQHLLVNTFLVGERITLADLFTTGLLLRGFQCLFDKKWRAEHPNVTRWYETVYNQPIYSAVAGKLEFIDEAMKNQAPKQAPKEKKEQPKAAPKPKAKEPEEEEEEAPPAPKPKHPLDALPKPTLALDDWKRKYSNEETREVALPWFWENFNAEEYSLWRVDYKYNDELKMTFMSTNLIGEWPNHPPISGPSSRKFQADSLHVSRLPGNTSSAAPPSLERPITPSFKARLLCADKKHCLRSMLRQTTKAMSSPSWIQARRKTKSSLRTNGRETRPSWSMARKWMSLDPSASSKRLVACVQMDNTEYIFECA